MNLPALGVLVDRPSPGHGRRGTDLRAKLALRHEEEGWQRRDPMLSSQSVTASKQFFPPPGVVRVICDLTIFLYLTVFFSSPASNN